MCAVLLGGQFVFSFVAGVEIVTLLLACFSYVFGVKCGSVCATAFSLLRCFIYGFYPNVVILYLVYYPLLATVFGGLGKLKDETFTHIGFIIAVNALFILLSSACAACAVFNLIKVSRLYRTAVNALLWVIFALCLILVVLYDGFLIALKTFKKGSLLSVKLFAICAVGAVCAAIFTLADDVISPLVLGFSRETALAYFYSSFLAMLPQTVCAVITLGTLFLPVSACLKRIRKKLI